MNRINQILSIIAGLVILLHTVTPHVHHSELSDTEHVEQHETADNLFDYFQLLFHIDQQEGHLEEFTEVDSDFSVEKILSSVNVFSNDFEVYSFNIIVKNEISEPNINSTIVEQQNYLNYLILRGPPTLS